jgi:hypothetical protein
MNFELKIRNIVLVGLFNPLGFDKYFFVKNGIVSEEQIMQNSIFLPQLVQIVTSNFHFTINNLQLVINAVVPTDDSDEIAQILIKLIDVQKNLNVGGSGINFNWFVSKDKNVRSLPTFSRELCFNSQNRIQNEVFNQKDATFGYYSSKDILYTRLKLDVKPIIFRQTNESEEESALQFEFNFHKDYKEVEKSSSELIDLLHNYTSFRKETENIIARLS